MRTGRFFVYGIILLAGIALGFMLTSYRQPAEASNAATGAGSDRAYETSHADDHSQTTPAAQSDWCSEHWFPESECIICNPELVEKFKSEGNWCGEHGFPETHCRKCNPRLTFPQEPPSTPGAMADVAKPVSVFFPPNDRACAPEQALITFASLETPARLGLKTGLTMAAAGGGAVEAPAELVFNETDVFAITTSVAATVVQWRVDPGDHMTAGQVLAELESPEIAQLKADYLEAYATWSLETIQGKRSDDLFQRKLISRAEYEDAEAHVGMSQSRLHGIAGRLRSAGVSDADISALETGQRIDSKWVLHAAKAGTVLERRAPLGELLAAGSTLAMAGKPTALWIEAHVREQDLSRFGIGLKVDFTEDGGEFSRIGGEVIWVAQYLDPDTRTGLVRARILSDPGHLKAHLFGRIRLVDPAPQSAVLVAKDAVQWEGCCHIVFVQESLDRYRPRKVTIERGDGKHYLVTSGLQAGEMVVTDGSFLLKSELMKENLGVGCAGE